MNPSNRKADDAKVIALNSVGLSLCSIGRRLSIHHTTVANRLRILGISPAETRRAFMDDIYGSLNQEQQRWLQAKVDPGLTIKDYVRSLIVREYLRETRP